MPAQKDFKRLVRARMQKTGEAYTTARAHFLTKPSLPTAPLATPPDAPDYGRVAGMSDATIKAKTGCTWERWVRALDRVGAHEWRHGEIARHIAEKYNVPGWWTQTVTVGYERIKGLRAIGQRRDGGYEASKSKVVKAPLARVYRAFHDARTRRRWLGDVKLKVRTATRDKTMRVTWPDGSAVNVYFVGKGSAKAQVAVQHCKLADKAAADRMKAWWGDRLAALDTVLSRARS